MTPHNHDYFLTYDLRNPAWRRRLMTAIFKLGPCRRTQQSVWRVSSPLDGPTIVSLLKDATDGCADVLVIEARAVHEHSGD